MAVEGQTKPNPTLYEQPPLRVTKEGDYLPRCKFSRKTFPTCPQALGVLRPASRQQSGLRNTEKPKEKTRLVNKRKSLPLQRVHSIGKVLLNHSSD
ncbi:hypothetical protein CDAR_430351 [Caerostris darwini]|uniref:Uncharacterized protein n=1 Tax=Caerostris darwini TaxID=1538125 RepID=A0AAV4UTI8_9ARAC|nr:hypothetical protein CDAR_430351 [Caerostris darwini]